MVENIALRLWAEIRINNLSDKIHYAKLSVWHAETFLYMHPNEIVQLKEENEEDDIPKVVSELEEELKTVTGAYVSTYKLYSQIMKIAKEGQFTETLQEEALEENSKFTKAYRSLIEKCDWYKDEITERLKQMDDGR